MKQPAFLSALERERAVAIIRTDTQAGANLAMDAAVRAGFRCIEFTLGCPGAFELVEEFVGRPEDLQVGVGTVLTEDEARRALDAGASFIVSPITDEAVISVALEAGAVAMPGAFTATELHRAWRAGAQVQKLFPAPANGPDYVRMVSGPMPFLRIVPTSGVTPANAADWFAAGVHAVGFVACLFDPADMAAGRYDAIETRARQCLEAVAEFRSPPSGSERVEQQNA